jgi:hypothetical protein
VKNEWEVLRDWLDEIQASAPRASRGDVIKLRLKFEKLDAARGGMLDVLADFAASGISTETIEAVERRHLEPMLGRWQAIFSDVATLQASISRTRTRGRTKHADYKKDREIAFNAALARAIDPTRALRPAILKYAAAIGIAYASDPADTRSDALYRRIKRLIDDPLENISGAVTMAIHRALDGQET